MMTLSHIQMTVLKMKLNLIVMITKKPVVMMSRINLKIAFIDNR